MKLLALFLKKKNSIKFKIGERIRDIIQFDNENYVVALEESPGLALITLKLSILEIPPYCFHELLDIVFIIHLLSILFTVFNRIVIILMTK